MFKRFVSLFLRGRFSAWLKQNGMRLRLLNQIEIDIESG